MITAAFSKRQFVGTLLAAVCACVGAQEAYPSRPIKLIVPYTPGQGADSAARLVATKLSERLKQPIVIENRPGAAGNIGAEAAAKAPADGYTLLVGSNATHAANAALYASLRFDPIKDFIPVAYIGAVPMALIAAPNFAASNIRELIQLAKAQPDGVSVAVPSSTARVVLEMLSKSSGANFKDVPYKGSSAAITDVLGGHVQLSIDTAMAATPQINAGKMKALGVTSSTRTSVLPTVPSFAESGLPGFSLVAWNVWFAPRGTPPDIVAKLNTEIAKVLADGDTIAKMRALGYEPGGTEDPQKVVAFVNAETKKWGELIRAAGIKAE